MLTIPALAAMVDTLLVRPVDLPAPWYSVATGVLSIIVTLLLLGIAVALLGMARALKGAENRLGGRMQGLADELIPLARNLNQIATQLTEVTTEARGDLKRLSGTIGAVDDAVRDVIDAGEARLARFGVLLDVLQDEAQATVASATGAMRGVRTGAGSLVSNLFRGRERGARPSASRSRDRDDHALTETDIRARLAALEAAFLAPDEADEADDVVESTRRPPASYATESDDDWDDLDDADDEPPRADGPADDDDDDDDDLLDDDLDDDDDDINDDDDDLDEDDDDLDDDDDDDADTADETDKDRERVTEASTGASIPRADTPPRHGGPRIRGRRRA